MLVEPPLTPPVPTEASTIPGTPQMPPYLLLNPVFDEAKASTRIPHGKVLHPAAKHRVDEFHHAFARLGLEPSENDPELVQQRRPLLQLGRVAWPPHSPAAAYPTILEAKESEALPF